MTPIDPGRFTRAAIHNDAGEVELRLSSGGNWQLNIRGTDDRDWRLACSGDLEGGAFAPQATQPPEPIRLGSLLVDAESRRVLVKDAELALNAREFELLAQLASQPNRVFTKQELLRSVWGYSGLERTRTLDTHASRLRVKLRKAGAAGLVVNCPSIGYKLWNGVELASAARRAA